MNKCKHCKYFGDPETYKEWRDEEIETRLHLCKRIGHINGTIYFPPKAYDQFSDPVAVKDEDGGYARLIVAEDFGCVLWEQAAR